MTDDKRCETCRWREPHCCYENKLKQTGKKGCTAWEQKLKSVVDERKRQRN